MRLVPFTNCRCAEYGVAHTEGGVDVAVDRPDREFAIATLHRDYVPMNLAFRVGRAQRDGTISSINKFSGSILYIPEMGAPKRRLISLIQSTNAKYTFEYDHLISKLTVHFESFIFCFAGKFTAYTMEFYLAFVTFHEFFK